MMVKRFRKFPFGAANTPVKMAVIMGVLLLNGCSQLTAPTQKPAASTAPYTLLNSESSALLANARAGEQLTLPQSPWGAQVNLQILERYFAASGRTCLQALVEVGAKPPVVVICQYAETGWGASRDLRGQQALIN